MHSRSSGNLSLSWNLKGLKLEREEYFDFWYILARRLEKEEYERLKTEEQSQMIFEKLMKQSNSIEEREKSMRSKLKTIISSFEE